MHKMDVAFEVWRISIPKNDATSVSTAGKPTVNTVVLMFERWMCSAIKRVKGQTRSCPLKCRWNVNPSSVYHFLHSTPTTFNDEWTQLKSREQELGSLVCSLGLPHYKNCYRHLARPPPPSFWVSHPIWWIALLINTAVKIAMPFILCFSLKVRPPPSTPFYPSREIDWY